MKKLTSIIFACGFSLLANQANANVLGSAANPTNFLPNLSTTATYVPLLPSGVNYMHFYVPVSGLVSITYNAECNVSATSSGKWIGLEIRVDGSTPIPPSSMTKSFCTSTPNISTWVSASSDVTPYLTAGWHYVQVRVQEFGTGTGWLGDSIVTVMQ